MTAAAGIADEFLASGPPVASATIHVALVDDHRLFLEGLRGMIETQRDFAVVGEASDATAAYEMIERTAPDVLILDLALPGATGLTVARESMRRHPRLRILILSMLVDEERVAQALDAGVVGYASKVQPSEEIFAGIRIVAADRSYFSPQVSRFVLSEYRRMSRGGTPGSGPLRDLTVREREIFDLTARGLSIDTIATQLFISKRTVETHRSRLMAKLGAHSAADLVRIAARHGLLQQE